MQIASILGKNAAPVSMGESFFSNTADDLILSLDKVIKPIEEVDAYTFITSPSFLNEKPTPFQRIIIKTLYNLWWKYPPDAEELYLIELSLNKWGIKINYTEPTHIIYLILVLGRRGTKSTLMSYIATYEIYSLICKGNPQEYYGIRERHPIHVMHVASAGSQAEDVFTLSYDNIRKTPFFRDYIDFEKDNSTTLRLFTPYDLMLNATIRERNNRIIRGSGVQKETMLPGSLFIESVTTSAASARGKSVKTLLLSEFAHFLRAKMGNGIEGGVVTTNPRTDYEIWKALTPSVKDYNKNGRNDGKVVAESSPLEKGGEHYNQYKIGGGTEVDSGIARTPEKGYQVLQFASWEARPGFVEEDFTVEFNTDPIGASAEYGAHFINPSGTFIPEDSIVGALKYEIPMIHTNTGAWHFVISIDPGGKAKKKIADTYALSWGHTEKESMGERYAQYWVDGFEGFNAEIINSGGGKFEQIPVDPNIVTDYVVDLVKHLGGRNFITEIVYDQFDSGAPVSTLQSLGFRAIETFFTNKYKSLMYGNYLAKLLNNQVYIRAGEDPKNYCYIWSQEMKYLQRVTRGDHTFYSHPATGPVRHDDYADSSANLIYRLSMRVAPTKESIEENRKHGIGPIQRKVTVVPLTGPSLHKGGNSSGLSRGGGITGGIIGGSRSPFNRIRGR